MKVFDLPIGELLAMLSLFGVVLFWEFRNQPAFRRPIRLMCWTLASSGLAILYWQPAVNTAAPERTAIIFTEGTLAAQREDMIRSGEYIEVSDLTEINEVPYDLKQVLITGDGLLPEQLQTLSDYPIEYQPGSLPEGITHIYVPDITEGLPFTISGRINNRTKMTLVLQDPTSETIPLVLPQGDRSFQFETRVSVAGHYSFQLIGIDQQDTLFREILPVKVQPDQQPNVLLMGAFPSFEFNTLKNHLSDLGFGVASRFQLSRDLFHTEFLNTERINLNRLKAQALSSFKLVIMDGDTWENLPRSERNSVLRAVETAELGLFLLVDDLTPINTIDVIAAVRSKGELAISTPEKQLMLNTLPSRITDPDWVTIPFEKQEVAAYTHRGLGKIGFSLILDSHVLELQGASTTYAAVWNAILAPLMGFDIRDRQFHHSPFAFVDDQLDLSFDDTAAPTVTINGDFIPAINSPLRQDLWSVTYWPQKRGWHDLQVREGGGFYRFFVHSPHEWQGIRRHQLQEYNRYFAQSNPYTVRSPRLIRKPISLWYGFILFILAMGGLWLERKFH